MMGEKLTCKKDEREEAKEHDENAIGVYQPKTEDGDILVGHVPIELSRLIKYLKPTSLTTCLPPLLVKEKGRSV